MINIILYQPEIPSNTGNILRTSAATGSLVHIIGPTQFTLNDESLKRKIAFSYGYHYFYKGEIIKREKVALYKYKVINN